MTSFTKTIFFPTKVCLLIGTLLSYNNIWAREFFIVFEEAQQFSVHFKALVLGYLCEIRSLKARLICFIYHVAHIYSVEI